LARMEGKDYVMNDGDVVFFRIGKWGVSINMQYAIKSQIPNLKFQTIAKD
jgi:hypothetical protein